MQKGSWLLFSLMLLSCSKEGVVPELGHDYFPIAVGAYRVYEVEETTYVNKVATTVNYQLRERFTDQIREDDESSYLMLIERREDVEDDWVPIESIYIRQSTYRLEYRRQNVTYVAMTYPVRTGREWNGNGLNTEPSAIYRYEAVDANDQIKVVISDLPPNIVERDQRSEVYEQGIGLISRSYDVIEFCQSSCESINQPENGRILTQQLIDYGTE